MAKFEPLTKPVNFGQDSWPMLGTKTLRLDLTPSTEKIFGQFKKDCRYALRKAQNIKTQVQINDFDNFYSIWKKAASIKHLWTPSKKDFDSLVSCFGKNCFCVTINNLAGSFILIHDTVAYYYYSGALPQAKKLDLPYLVIWECIQEAKKRGCKTWDFEGIYDSRWPNKSWLGFSHFKKSFGGYEVEFPGSFTKWF
jgi:lipid II:glycine glycyltransferase (peptidoglycan interpeptide bridge formation enzyme)